MSEHDLLIRIDERVEELDSKVEKMNGIRPRIARLEAYITIIILVVLGLLSCLLTGVI